MTTNTHVTDEVIAAAVEERIRKEIDAGRLTYVTDNEVNDGLIAEVDGLRFEFRYAEPTDWIWDYARSDHSDDEWMDLSSEEKDALFEHSAYLMIQRSLEQGAAMYVVESQIRRELAA